MNKKIIAFDIDGTLIPYGEKILSEKLLYAFKTLKQKGFIIILASGRDLIATKNLFDQYDSFDYFVGGNGSFAYDIQNRKIVYENALNFSEIKTLIRKFDLKIENIFISNNESVFVDFEGIEQNRLKTFLSIWKKTDVKNIKDLKDLDELDKGNRANIFILKNLSDEKKEQISQYIKNSHFNFEIKKETATGLYIQNIEQNKYNAILNLAKIENFDVSELITFGDGWNDFEMIKFAKYGVAIENGDPVLLKVAKDFAKPVEDEGVFLKLKELGLI
ncbi:YcsE-related riboflavin metabolism phosphatase [[Mycoplasma] mobile]|uniref:COF family HAD hydrolase protein n=1 Tax=Mycoplasma mobile (strain ATCC 43663 / 163K / NCTC 11711) TaxID=267748 RepID=Q6KHH7_MYCM1|nr:HAD family hydrolase [[Mycoplasma] mobile]AAT27953.1 COF family HAD hydrolase protein [Mycoplasma mobile 163K]